ncbi:uncharacterized protein K452DRAFT_356220 [Aplosporella prunicola CBS 121167]|uniref:Transmembrane protein 135 N-terminal domain-containing protein n=1 Tax=Aplosporella prunicola CBS 121167 TaxID=1176127 RepID=A0A6A6BPT5_9PEZI|nr:uncharacterized protein K452DRAFT_356220 [Aplosporella prunicola CBS 121167]KAF2144847.1 hypothetical protein K452DRAFT_356220 [Aplosporella prunicola CBS 121167]
MSSASSSSKDDPVLRNALRYTLSTREYKLLHDHLIAHAPPAARQRAPPPRRYEAIVKSKDDYNAAAVRASLRLGLATYGGLKLWELVSTRLMHKARQQVAKSKTPVWKSPNVRLSCSLSFILFFHRVLHRFFIRLRETLHTDEAKPFRARNPGVTKALTSNLTPAIGASLSGFFLGLCPADQLRVTIAIYIFTKSLEFAYNGLEDRGWFKDRPWWFGSWLLYPLAAGQLLHAFVFDRDCFPASYGQFIMKNSPEYVHPRPARYAGRIPWPDTPTYVDSLAEIARLRWPPYVSPIMFPNKQTLPARLLPISPITSPAHPAITRLSCALLHPNDPSCARTYITYFIRAFPPVARFFTVIFGVLSLPRYKAFAAAPFTTLNSLAARILRMALFVTGAIGTSWSSICLFQHYLPHSLLPTQRFFVSGALGGLWAVLERKDGRGTFLYSLRLSLASFWKVGIKRGWWRGVRGGDVWLFVASLALLNAVYEVDPKAVSGGALRKSLGMLRGEGWVDRAAVAATATATVTGKKKGGKDKGRRAATAEEKEEEDEALLLEEREEKASSAPPVPVSAKEYKELLAVAGDQEE